MVSILADKFPVKVGGTIYPVYVHSYLHYGQNYADLWVKQFLYDERPEKDNIDNPCMLKGKRIQHFIIGFICILIMVVWKTCVV